MSSFLNNIQNISLSSIKNSIDEVRAQYMPNNETEKKVYEALSSKNWGASSTLLNDIASDTYDYEKYNIIMELIWKNIETDGKTWKHIFKTLTLVEFLIKNGSERCIEAARDKMYRIRGLQEFTYYEASIDKASGIREKARQIIELLGSNETIRMERDKARQLRNKFVGVGSDRRDTGNYGNGGGSYGGSNQSYGNSGVGSSYDSYSGSNNGNTNTNTNASESNGGRYSDSNSYNNYNSKPSGYGGGAYDSNKPTRYSDDASSGSHDIDSSRGYDNFDAAPKASSRSQPIAAPEKTGKFKVTIKKVNDTSSTSTSVAPATSSKPVEVDLFDMSDNFSTPAPPPPPVPSQSFDPFGNSDPFSSSVASQSNHTTTIDPFASSPAFVATPTAAPVPSFQTTFAPAPTVPVVAPVSQQKFDMFGGFQDSNSMATPSSNLFPNTSISMQQIPMQVPVPVSVPTSFGTPYAPAPAMTMNQFAPMATMATMGNMGIGVQQSQPLGITHIPSPVNANTNTSVHNDFGDFESASGSKTNTNVNVGGKWGGDISKLVDLGSIAKNEEKKPVVAPGAPSYSAYGNVNNSFAGLDGFSKNQNQTSNRPMQTQLPNRPMAPMAPMAPMMQQPMANPSMGMGYMGQPPPLPQQQQQQMFQQQYGAPMQQQMQQPQMFAQQYGAPMQPQMQQQPGMNGFTQPGMGGNMYGNFQSQDPNQQFRF